MRRAARHGWGRRAVALGTGAAVVIGLSVLARVSVAGTGEPGPALPAALAEAARIPNDQGPDPRCLATRHTDHRRPGKPRPGTTTPAPSRPAEPSGGPPSAGPSGEPVEPSGAPVEPSGDPVEPSGGPGEPSPAQPPASPSAPGRPSAPGGAPDPCHGDQGGPARGDFVSILDVRPNANNPRPGRDASRGTFVTECGRNENNHRNPDNFIVAPGVTNGAHHVHDYVGNLSADAFSTDESLAAAGTTCRRGDRSVFFWPVLRRIGTIGDDAQADGGGNDGNVGRILRPGSVRLEFRGNPHSRVVAMPRFLRVITGDAKAGTNGPANARAQWTCTGFTNRLTTRYPVCPRGSQVQRILVFPSCWDGANTDSANHRAHIVFPARDGRCPEGTRAVPQLRMTLTYSVPGGRSFALDSFPEQKHNPLTDHADFVNVMPDTLMAFATGCINRGRRC